MPKVSKAKKVENHPTLEKADSVKKGQSSVSPVLDEPLEVKKSPEQVISGAPLSHKPVLNALPTDLSGTVGRMLHGDRDPKKEIDGIRITTVFTDGTTSEEFIKREPATWFQLHHDRKCLVVKSKSLPDSDMRQSGSFTATDTITIDRYREGDWDASWDTLEREIRRKKDEELKKWKSVDSRGRGACGPMSY